MSWNGEIVIDLDSHVVERADRFYDSYIDPGFRAAYQQLCDGVAQQVKAGTATRCSAVARPSSSRSRRDGPSVFATPSA